MLETTLNLGFLSIDIGTIFFVLLNTFVLLLGMKLLLFDKVNAILEKRQAAITADYDKASEARQAAEKTKTEYETMMSSSKDEAETIVRAAKTKAERRSEEIIAQAKTEAEAITEKAKADIALETKRARASLRDEIGQLSTEIASKIVKREIKKQEHDKLIAEFIDTVGEF